MLKNLKNKNILLSLDNQNNPLFKWDILLISKKNNDYHDFSLLIKSVNDYFTSTYIGTPLFDIRLIDNSNILFNLTSVPFDINEINIIITNFKSDENNASITVKSIDNHNLISSLKTILLDNNCNDEKNLNTMKLIKEDDIWFIKI